MNLPHMAQLSREPPAEVPAPGDAATHPTHQLGGAMTTTNSHATSRYAAQLAYARSIRDRGLPALLAPYTLPAPVVPAQRRRSVQRERISA